MSATLTSCPRCLGGGEIGVCPPSCDGSHVNDDYKACPDCSGRGQVAAFVELDTDPHIGYDGVETYGEPFDTYIATLDAEGTGCSRPTCEAAVGSSTYDDFTDDGHRMASRWSYLALIVEDGEVKPLCDTCATVLLPALERA